MTWHPPIIIPDFGPTAPTNTIFSHLQPTRIVGSPKFCMVVEDVVPIIKYANLFSMQHIVFPTRCKNVDFWPLCNNLYRHLPVNTWLRPRPRDCCMTEWNARHIVFIYVLTNNGDYRLTVVCLIKLSLTEYHTLMSANCNCNCIVSTVMVETCALISLLMMWSLVIGPGVILDINLQFYLSKLECELCGRRYW